jgi:3-hydroxymyristoyl/3-hydroxydecanoyl-(acyl carrier protein) dehydratase
VDFTVENILIPADHPCFEGHFPGHPVFPAVAQIDLVMDLLQKQSGRKRDAVGITKAKFPAPILPGSHVHVFLRIEDQTVSWRIFGNDYTYSVGTVQLIPLC